MAEIKFDVMEHIGVIQNLQKAEKWGRESQGLPICRGYGNYIDTVFRSKEVRFKEPDLQYRVK